MAAMIDAQHSEQDALSAAGGFIRRFCILPESAYLPLSLWAIATHISEAFGAFPYIALLSPAKRSGKTRVLEVLELLCARPQRITSGSPASIFRLMKNAPTLLLDEVEALRSNKTSESAQAILSILNAGHRKGATVTRCGSQDKDFEPVHFPVYGPKAFAAIGRLPDTLADRSICIPMQRKAASQHVARFLFARTPTEAQPIRKLIEAWAEANRDTVQQSYEQMGDLDFLTDREADLWMPLFAACAVAAPKRIAELKRCAQVLSGAKAADDVDDSVALTLLDDVRSVWTAGSLNMLTASLITALEQLPESRWPEPENRLTPIKLAGILRPFGILPGTIRVGQGTAKGYKLADFESAFSRYLPQNIAQPVTAVTTRINTGENTLFRPVTAGMCDGSENTWKPA